MIKTRHICKFCKRKRYINLLVKHLKGGERKKSFWRCRAITNCAIIRDMKIELLEMKLKRKKSC